MASLTWRTWIWASSGSWWWTGNPSVLQSMGSQRVGQDWVTELNWSELKHAYPSQNKPPLIHSSTPSFPVTIFLPPFPWGPETFFFYHDDYSFLPQSCTLVLSSQPIPFLVKTLPSLQKWAYVPDSTNCGHYLYSAISDWPWDLRNQGPKKVNRNHTGYFKERWINPGNS